MPLTKVTAGVIAANAVIDSIGSQSLTGDKIGLTAINANNIVDGAVTGNKLDLTAINANNIVDGAVTGNKLGLTSINANNIVNGSITSEKINTSVFATTSNIFGVTANSNTFSNTIIIVSGNTAPINVGMLVAGSNVTPGTTVLSFNTPPSGRSNITLSAATVGTNTNTAFSFYETNKVLSPGIAGPGLCKAWVNFNGQGVGVPPIQIRAAYNVSSITDNGTGDYTVNFTNAMPDANYCSVFGTRETNVFGSQSVNGLGIDRTVAPSAAALRFTSRGTSNGTAYDSDFLSVAIFR